MELNKSDIEISMLYNRAAEVSEKRKSYIKAVAYYTKAKNWDRIAALYAGKNGRRLIEKREYRRSYVGKISDCNA